MSTEPIGESGKTDRRHLCLACGELFASECACPSCGDEYVWGLTDIRDILAFYGFAIIPAADVPDTGGERV